MSGGKGVKFALGRRGESAESAIGEVSRELEASAGQELMGIGLMANVPDDAVIGSVIYIMESDRQVYGPHARRKMAGVAAQFVDKSFPKVSAYFRELIN